MERISALEHKYVLEVLSNQFKKSSANVFNQRLEKKFAEIITTNYAISHSNGTATLHTALAALGLTNEDEVIVPALTMASPALAVLQNGSIPVFADIDLDTFNISPTSILQNITSKTKAIIAVSLYGLPPNYEEILKICRKYKLFLIEDNAQCFLGSYKGKMVGGFGDFSSFSFQATKHLTAGEGGMLCTNNIDLANKALKFSRLGFAHVGINPEKKINFQDPAYQRHDSLGFNYKMPELIAAVALAQLERAEILVNQRIKVAKIFDQVLRNNSIFQKQTEPEGYKHTYWTYILALKTDHPEIDWHRFRALFKKNGGDDFYAAWQLNYLEPVFQNLNQNSSKIWQKYQRELCANAAYLQPRMLQFKTNYWDITEAEKQAEVLHRTIRNF